MPCRAAPCVGPKARHLLSVPQNVKETKKEDKITIVHVELLKLPAVVSALPRRSLHPHGIAQGALRAAEHGLTWQTSVIVQH